MGSLRTFLCLGALLVAPAARAGAPVDLVRIFSHCAGAYTAELEHAWLVGAPGAGRVESERAHIVAILDAITPDERGREVLALRVEARAAHRALLQEAAFGRDRDRSEWSEGRAERLIGRCRTLLLDG